MYQIVEGIPKPENMPVKKSGSKYPFPEMEVDTSFVVPYTDMKESEQPDTFRNRIYQSARNYALRDFHSQGAGGTKKEFSAVLMKEDDAQKPPRWSQGDVVVWRDK